MMNARFVVILLTGLLSQQASSAFENWDEVKNQTNSAIQTTDTAALRQIQQQLGNWNAAQTSWVHYWQAFISFRLIDLENDTELKDNAMLDCKQHAEAAINAGESSGESHALLGSCLGRLAAVDQSAGMRYGSKANSTQDESLLIAPDNPRVLLLAGLSDANKPVMWGGDIDRAERRLRRALEQLKSTNTQLKDDSPWLPNWGLHDAYGHLALALMKLERSDDALALIEEARNNSITSDWLESIANRLQGTSE